MAVTQEEEERSNERVRRGEEEETGIDVLYMNLPSIITGFKLPA